MRNKMVYKLFHNINLIFNGWYNFIFRKPYIEIVAKNRMRICKSCSHMRFGICSRCSCPNVGKVRSLKSYCPEGHWGKYNPIIEKQGEDYVPMMDFESSDDYIIFLNNK